jgi:pimeloyl-ACP methyl ester carboxylesterase
MTGDQRVPELHLTDAPPLRVQQFDLPLTSLRVGIAGEGPPVIMVPATISLIEDWSSMIRVIGKRYTAHFFELPGHGGSTPFVDGYSAERVAETIGHLANAIGAERFTLLGFSFGGLLTLKALKMHEARVDRVVLFSPFVTHRALRHSPARLAMLRSTIAALKPELARRGMLSLLHNPATVSLIDWYMRDVGKFETAADLSKRLSGFSASTLDVLLAQVGQILTTRGDDLAGPFGAPCLFGMSVNDPMLDFDVTAQFVHTQFPNLTEERWDWPYHATPRPLTVEEYTRDFAALLDW